MDEMELMMHLHRNNKRQGPGSEDATNLAVTLAKIDREKSYKIAEVVVQANRLSLWQKC
jgi:hypothetical protein